MKKIDINLATRKETKDVIPYLVLAACIVIAALWSWRSVSLYRYNTSIAAFYKERIARAAKEPAAKGALPADASAGPGDVKRLKKEVEFINNVIARETYSWTRLLTGLERSSSDNIVVMRISPDFDDRKVTVSGLSMSVDDVLAMIDKMARSGLFTDVFLVKHGGSQAQKAAVPKDVIEFTLSAVYGAQDVI